jgi:hypothetical protein
MGCGEERKGGQVLRILISEHVIHPEFTGWYF